MPRVPESKIRHAALLYAQGEAWDKSAMKAGCVSYPCNAYTFRKNHREKIEAYIEEFREKEMDKIILSRNDKLKTSAKISEAANEILLDALQKLRTDEEFKENASLKDVMEIAKLAHKISNESGRRDDKLQGHEKEPEQNERTALQNALISAIQSAKEPKKVNPEHQAIDV